MSYIHDVLIVGAGAAGIATAASLKKRRPELSVTLIDPADVHYYQPGWTLVGCGVFSPEQTARRMDTLIPEGVKLIKAAVAALEPESSTLVLSNQERLQYKRLIVAPGLVLNWQGIEGLSETLGKNGVTSNYRYDLAPYTWELVQSLKHGRAVFTQPPMPIKCAGAPLKHTFLIDDIARRAGNAGKVNMVYAAPQDTLFGVPIVAEKVRMLFEDRGVEAMLNRTLTAIDVGAKEGPRLPRTAASRA